MAETGTLPTGNGAVFALFEMFALAFAFEGTTVLLSGRSSIKVAGAYIAAVALFFAGLKWSSLKSSLAPSFASSFVRLANNAYLWFLALLIVFSYIGAPSLLQQLRSKTLTPEQSQVRTQEISQVNSLISAAGPKSPIALIKDDDFETREKFRPILMSSARAGRPHPIEIVATLESQEVAIHLAGWIAMSGWQPRDHGHPNAWVGVPNEYALDDGVTIRAHEDSVNAETVHFALAMIGITARIVVLPVTDNRDYPILEVGNLPR